MDHFQIKNLEYSMSVTFLVVQSHYVKRLCRNAEKELGITLINEESALLNRNGGKKK